jgi:hypothetical protein
MFGEAFGPEVLTAIQQITKALQDNRDTFKSWADTAADAARGVGYLVSGLKDLSDTYSQLFGYGIPEWMRFLSYFSPPILAYRGLSALGALTPDQQKNAAMPDYVTPLSKSPSQQILGMSPFKATFMGATPRSGSGGGGGGGRGGGRGGGGDPARDAKRMAEIQLQILVEGNNREEDDVERSYDQRRTTVEAYQRAITRLEESHHDAVLEGLKAEEAAINSSQKLTKGQKAVQLQELELKRIQEANRHREEENRLEDNILRITRERLVTAERLAALTTRPRRVGEDIGGVTRPRTTGEDIGGLTRPRIATTTEEALRAQYREHMEQIERLAYQTTNIIDRAIYDGFQGGLKKGFASLTLSILDMIKNVFLTQLQSAITNALAGATAGGSKGGFFSSLFGALLGGLKFGGGSATGGAGSALAGAIGGHASGGYMKPNSLSWVGERGPELFRAGSSGGSVIPNHAIGNTIININVPVRSAGSYSSPRSRRQLAEDIAAALNGV